MWQLVRPYGPYRRRRDSLFFAVVQGVGGGQAAIRAWFPPAGKSLFFRRTASGQRWLPRRAVTCGPREKRKCTKNTITPTHVHMHANKNSVDLRVPVAWGVKESTNSSWMAPLAAFIAPPWIFDCWKKGKKAIRVTKCVRAGAVAFISVVVKTDLLTPYLVKTRGKKRFFFVLLQDKNSYLRVNLVQNTKIKSDWGTRWGNIIPSLILRWDNINNITWVPLAAWCLTI